MAAQTMGTMFPEEIITDLFNKVKGHSTLAKLSGRAPIAMTGTDVFTFDMDSEVDIVAEGGAKSHGGITVAPVKMMPVKVEYGARVTDEFLYATESKKLDILENFTEGWSKKLARGIDIMGMHGLNPRTRAASAIIGNNCLDKATGVNVISYASGSEEANLEAAIAALGDWDNSGYAFSKVFAAALGQLKVNGVPQFPEFRFGGNPDAFNGVPSDVNGTVSFGNAANSSRYAYVGDFANAFKYGIAKEIPLEIIPYGNPDNDAEAGDLKGHNQVYLRCEAYVGWGILVGAAFSRIATETA